MKTKFQKGPDTDEAKSSPLPTKKDRGTGANAPVPRSVIFSSDEPGKKERQSG